MHSRRALPALVLTDITVNDPMYVYFNLNERDLLTVLELYRKRVREKGIDPSAESDVRAELALELGLATEKSYPHRGLYDFGESQVDSGTGTLQLRGVFDNKEVPVRLIPDLFARVRMPILTRPDMPLVSERAVGADQTGTYLLVVGADDTVEKRTVELGQLIDGLRVVESGISPGERIVVNGLQRARPGAKVRPSPADMNGFRVSALIAATAPDSQ